MNSKAMKVNYFQNHLAVNVIVKKSLQKEVLVKPVFTE